MKCFNTLSKADVKHEASKGGIDATQLQWEANNVYCTCKLYHPIIPYWCGRETIFSVNTSEVECRQYLSKVSGVRYGVTFECQFT